MPKPFDREAELNRMGPTPAGVTRAIPSNWLGWGEPIEIIHECLEPGDGVWNAFYLLAKYDGDISSDQIDLDKLRAHDATEGASNFSVSSSIKDPRLNIPSIPVPIELHTGKDGMIRGMELKGFKADSIQHALILAATYFNIITATLIFAYNVPLRIRQLHVARANQPEETGYRVYIPYADLPLENVAVMMPSGLIGRLMFSYAEGVRSNSPAYRFLCFFKLVEHILVKAGPALRKMRTINFPTIGWQELDGTLPEDPIAFYDKAAVGLSFKKALERYLMLAGGRRGSGADRLTVVGRAPVV